MDEKKVSKIIEFPQEWEERSKLPNVVALPKDPFEIYNAKHSVEFLCSLPGPVNKEIILSDWE